MKKRIILLCDGTWNDLEMRYITNVGRLAQIMEPEGQSGNSQITQVVYYDDGIAAHDTGIQKVIQGAIGGGMERNIYEAYRFLAFNYKQGDEVCMFGFSRGAYTVRSLAGLIGRVGLVPRTNMKFIPEAIQTYRGKEKAQLDFINKTGSKPIDIELLGCWDTVGALGIPDKIPWLSIDDFFNKRFRFHDTTLGAHIKHALHAVALHENRKEFDVTPMKMDPANKNRQTLKQVWFPGDHGCVGGGSWEKRGLSNMCLRWMLEESDSVGVKLGVKMERLKDQSIEDHSIYFCNEVNSPYSRKLRKIRASFDEIHDSARRRYLELPETQKGQMRRLFSKDMNNLGQDGIRNPLTQETHLNVGESAYVRVYAKSKASKSFIEVKKGERFRFVISRPQVWKDGFLDPCDILGWNLKKEKDPEARQPWEDGKPADINLLKSKLIKSGRSNRLVKEANWFELVLSLDEKNFVRLNIKKPKKETDDFSISYRSTEEGMIYFAANDFSLGIIDKFENNRGWIWVEVQRTA